MWNHLWVVNFLGFMIENAFKVQWTCRNSWIFADRGGWWVGARSKFLFGAFKDVVKREGYWWVLMCIDVYWMISKAVWDCSGTEFLHCRVLMSVKTMSMWCLFHSSQKDWIRNVGCSFTWHIVQSTLTSIPSMDKTTPIGTTSLRMSKLDFESTLHLGDMAKSLAKAQLIHSKWPAWCLFSKRIGVSGRAKGVGIHGDDGRPSPCLESCVASPYLIIDDCWLRSETNINILYDVHCLICNMSYNFHIFNLLMR